MRRWPRITLLILLLPALAPALAPAADALPSLPVEEHVLANGMRLLLLPRPGSGVVEAGWVVRAGTADEPAGASGLAHLVEHMLFQGTRTIAARDLASELPLLAREDELEAERLRLEAEAAQPRIPERRLAGLRRRLAALTAELGSLLERLRQLILPGEFSLRYSQAGATGLDASTDHDFTLFTVSLPAEKLELWFWLESDRLREPVFRELAREKQVVAAERSLRVESTPTGRLEEDLAGAFWGASAYGVPTLGHAEEVARLGRPQLLDFFRRHYTAERLTAALVGDFEPARSRALSERYFERLPAAPPDPAVTPVAGAPARPAAPSPWRGSCDCPDQARVLYRTVPLAHPDTHALQLLAGLLNGRSGRLYRSLVVEQGIAFAAFAQQRPHADEGAFEVTLEAKGGHDPADLVAAWDAELARLLAVPVPPVELERARNVLLAESLRELREPAQLLRRLLVYDALAGWRLLADWPQGIAATTELEVREAARRHLAPERRFVALVRRAGRAA